MSRSIKPHLPQVVCYHAELHVQDGEQVKTLEVPCPDWAPDEEILESLAMKYKAETVGDIVAAMEREGMVRVESGVVGKEVIPVERRLI